jgi:hypothetical protein
MASAMENVQRSYPLQLTLTPQRYENRWWGIPIVGPVVRLILLLPQLAVLAFEVVVGIFWLAVFGWVPILFKGVVPEVQAQVLEDIIHRSNRVNAYLDLMPGGYPPFGVQEAGPTDTKFKFDGRPINQLWGVPIVGLAVRWFVLIPQLIVLAALTIAVYAVYLVVWIPILISGRFPDGVATFYASVLRYGARILAYGFLLPVPYPPFSLAAE